MTTHKKDNRHFADNFIPVILVDSIDHTDNKPFCWNGGCDCHEDQESIAQVYQYVQDGLMTPGEAIDFVNGKML